MFALASVMYMIFKCFVTDAAEMHALLHCLTINWGEEDSSFSSNESLPSVTASTTSPVGHVLRYCRYDTQLRSHFCGTSHERYSGVHFRY